MIFITFRRRGRVTAALGMAPARRPEQRWERILNAVSREGEICAVIP